MSRTQHSVVAVVAGARVGLVTGLLAFVVDFSHAAAGGAERLLRLAASMASSFALALTLVGALAALWLFTVGGWAARAAAPISEGRRWLLSALASLPVGAAVFWVPSSWVIENYSGLNATQRRFAVLVYLGLLLGVVSLARGLWWVRDRYRTQPDRLPWLHWPLLAVSVLLAAACYLADGRVLVDLYEDFHYGLAGAFVASVAGCAVLALSTLSRLRPRTDQPATAAPKLMVWAAGLAGCAVIQLSFVSSVRAPQALLFSKLASSIQRHTDFDGDGYSGFYGGLDCAAFDRFRGPAQVDLPGNGVDEDCTGSDAHWPKRAPKPGYPIPDARGFNLLLITVDALRADRMSVFGHTRKTTPNLERLAQQALVFTRAYAQGSKTFESVPSLFTGLYPANLPRNYGHRRARGKKPYLYTLTDEAVVLTELLKQRGYRTRGIVSLSYMYVMGLDRGFDGFETTRDISGKARKVLRGAHEPFFMWLHYLEPHDPYVKHAKYAYGDSPLDRYDGEIARTDELIGRVLNDLARQKLADKTVVVVTADHGEEFREHGGQYHANKLYEELLHVPLIVKLPGVAAARVDQIVELTDVAPTLCEALRLLPDCGGFDGQSLWATLAGQRDERAGFRGAYSEASMRDGNLRRRSLLVDGFRLSLLLDTETIELFDVARDPREQRNVASSHPREVARLREEMALRPHRRLAEPFEHAARGDSAPLVQALPRLRSEPLLRLAVEAIAKHPSPGSERALRSLRERPGLGPSVKLKLDELLAAPDP